MKKNLKILLIILLLILVLFFVLKYAYSKYLNSVDIKSNANIAIPKIYFQNENQLNIPIYEKSISYNFSVKNYDEITSEVPIKYNLIFKYSQENAPILINLYKITGNSKEKIELSGNKTVNYETLGTDKEENNYVLEISRNVNSNVILENNFKINIAIDAIQEEV